MTHEELELYIEGHQLNKPRVTQDAIEENIVSEYYFTAGNGIDGAMLEALPGTPYSYEKSLDNVTFCVLVLQNGFKVVGINEGPVSFDNFDATLARKFAREDAIEQIWPLMGYALAERLNSSVH